MNDFNNSGPSKAEVLRCIRTVAVIDVALLERLMRVVNVQVRDREIFESLSHLDVRAYLIERGWRAIRRVRDLATIYAINDAEGREFEILLPTRNDLGDYANRMADVLRNVSLVEVRSEFGVLLDLLRAGDQHASGPP